MLITFTLLFAKWIAVGFLGRHFFPQTQSLAYVGFALALAGLAIALWARVSLGQYWSDKIVLKVDHQLIRSGPYARMRHPIYSGVLLAVAGSALVVDEWRGMLCVSITADELRGKSKTGGQNSGRSFLEKTSPNTNKRAAFLCRAFFQENNYLGENGSRAGFIAVAGTACFAFSTSSHLRIAGSAAGWPLRRFEPAQRCDRSRHNGSR